MREILFSLGVKDPNKKEENTVTINVENMDNHQLPVTSLPVIPTTLKRSNSVRCDCSIRSDTSISASDENGFTITEMDFQQILTTTIQTKHSKNPSPPTTREFDVNSNNTTKLSTTTSTSKSSESPSIASSITTTVTDNTINRPITTGINLLEAAVFKTIEGRCLESIFRLKVFLKTIYQISNDRCLSFNPDEKITIGNQPEKVKITDIPLLFTPLPINILSTNDYMEILKILKENKKQNMEIINNTKQHTINKGINLSDDFDFSTPSTDSLVTTNSIEHSSLPPLTLSITNVKKLFELMKFVVNDYNRLSHIMENDPSDFSLLVTKKKSRGGSKGRLRMN